MAKNPVVEFTMSVKDNKYQGKTRTQLVGSIKDGRSVFLISIQTDENGVPKIYTSKDDKDFIYARAVKFQDTPDGKRKRKNEF
jgi:hypothetical protein